MAIKDPSFYSNDISSQGYIESTASSTRKSKEKLRVDSLIPSEILENSAGIKQLLEAYYTFMNLDEFIYEEDESFTDIILNGKAVFRIPDPNNENDEFFTDEQGASSTLLLTDPSKGPGQAGYQQLFALDAQKVNISNGNELPGSLATLTSEVGKTFQVQMLVNNEISNVYNGFTAKLTTPVKYWVGPGPSHVLNNIEKAMDIDANSQQFLELMQKEIAAVIPRSITVNKRNLYKNIVDYYKVRGSADSIEIFFRLLFNDEVEVQFPWDKTLIPSSGNWDVDAALPKGGQYLDNKGQLSNTIKIQDSLRFQKFSYLIRTGQNVSAWENVFNRLVHPAGFKFFGEILMIIELSKAIMGEDTVQGDRLNRFVKSAMPFLQPGAIGIEDLPVLVEMFASIFLPEIQSRVHKTGTVSIPPQFLKNGIITSIAVTNPGSGYLTAPTLTSADTGTPAAHTTATLAANIANGSITSVTITNGGSDYNTAVLTAAAPPAHVFDGSDDEVGGTGIINLTDNTIKLTAPQAASIPVGARVTYSSGSGTAIGGLVSGTQYFIKTNSGTEVTLSATNGGAVIDITGTGSGTSHSFTGVTATLQPTTTSGIVTGIEISNPGYGYSGTQTLTFNGTAISGQSLVAPVITIGVDSEGRLDVDNITITSGGSGFAQIFGFVPANANATKFANILINGGSDKTYSSAPLIVIPQPTATDADGVLLSSNVQAAAKFNLEATTIKELHVTFGGSGYLSPPSVTISGNATAKAVIENGSVTKLIIVNAGSGYTELPTITMSTQLGGTQATAIARLTPSEISGTQITNVGSGYTGDPVLRIDSATTNEKRATLESILIILLNHVSDASRTDTTNNYFNTKGDSYLTSEKRFGYNETLDTLGSIQIQSTDTANINKYNVNSFIHTN
jgi:hypothetical protein